VTLDRKVVGLISDFGFGPYAGIMSEVVRCLGATPIDIDHSVPPFSVEAGAYIALESYKWLPKGSSLAVVVDPGVGTQRRAIIIKTRNYYLVGPNNGVLYPAALDDGIVSVYEIDVLKLLNLIKRYSRCKGFEDHKLSYTFHGRDIFAPAAALLALGVEPEEFSSEMDVKDLVELRLDSFIREDDTYKFKVIYIDRFGNVVLSSRLMPFNIGEEVTVFSKEVKLKAKIARTFQDVNLGEMLLYINSFGFLEIAVNQGNASSRLGVNIGDEVIISKRP
jgi:S-adenosylmethionine hydrolase